VNPAGGGAGGVCSGTVHSSAIVAAGAEAATPDTDEDPAMVVTTHAVSRTSDDRTDNSGAPRIDASSVSPAVVRATEWCLARRR